MEMSDINGYKICTRCIMNSSDSEITFDENGFCNHCNRYFENESKVLVKGENGKIALGNIIRKIKESQKDKEWDCLLGLSGGLDSSYVAYLAKKYGLRVYLFNLDNGWDSEEAKRNIERIVEYTGFELHTVRLNRDEFKDLQISYFKSSVVDIEMVTDHAIRASIFRFTQEKGIKYILRGNNYVSEAIMPSSWSHIKLDLQNIKSIHKKYGKRPIRTYPMMGYLKWVYYKVFMGIREVRVLNYVDYNIRDAKKLLKAEFGWEQYGEKHCESLFTKFYQFHILPTKFKIDKRRAHLSTLICSGQITRNQALVDLNKPLYDQNELESFIENLLEAWEMNREEYDNIMSLPRVKHKAFDTGSQLLALLRLGRKIIVKTGLAKLIDVGDG